MDREFNIQNYPFINFPDDGFEDDDAMNAEADEAANAEADDADNAEADDDMNAEADDADSDDESDSDDSDDDDIVIFNIPPTMNEYLAQRQLENDEAVDDDAFVDDLDDIPLAHRQEYPYVDISEEDFNRLFGN
jgi:hypothetical protein